MEGEQRAPAFLASAKSRFCMWWWWIGLIPVGFVWGMVGYGYFIYMYMIFVPMLAQHLALGVLELVVTHIVLFLMMASFVRTTFTSPGYVPANYAPGAIDEGSVIEGRTSPHFCRRCRHARPARAHHCRLCRQCVLKMDHHCPWVNNCVGFHNYKFFLLFLTYIPVTGLIAFLFALPFLISLDYSQALGPWNMQVFVVIGMAVLFGLGMAGFAGVHYQLVLRNETTLESFDEPSPRQIREGKRRRKNPFNLRSARKNFEQVFGPNPWLWFLPIHTTLGDGFNFPRLSDDMEAPPTQEYPDAPATSDELEDEEEGQVLGQRPPREERSLLRE